MCPQATLGAPKTEDGGQEQRDQLTAVSPLCPSEEARLYPRLAIGLEP